MTDIFLLYVTFPNKDEALAAADALLQQKLVACANIYDGVTSVYRWEGKMRQEQETVMIAKTSGAKREDAIALVKRLHSYEVPCIIAYPVTAGYPPFLQWVAEETQ